MKISSKRPPFPPAPLGSVPTAESLFTEELFTLINHTPRPMGLDDILRALRRLGVRRQQKREMQDALQELVRAGRIVRLPTGRWVQAGLVRTLTGILSAQRGGGAFVTPLPPNTDTDAAPDADTDIDKDADKTETPERPRRPGKPSPDIYIAPIDLNEAWHGDTVEVAVNPGGRRGNPEGRILRVITRGSTEFVVRVGEARTPRGLLCVPDDPRFPLSLDVDLSALRKIPGQPGLAEMPNPHDLMVVSLGERVGFNLWQASATRLLGPEDSLEAQERIVRLNCRIPDSFPPNVQAAAEQTRQLPHEFHCTPGDLTRNSSERRDVRHLPLVTIDGADARDFDDAVCVEKTGSGFVLWVAIADVSHYVRPGDALDREALQRGNSYYFPRSVTPMLPEILSNDLCSLRPHEDRPVIVARMEFSADGLPGAAAFYPGLIHSHARLTYEMVQDMLDARATLEPAVQAMLTTAAELARLLMDRRTAGGGLDLDLPEAEFEFDAENHLTGVRSRERLFSHRLIEAFMLAANEAVATFLTRKGNSFPLRIHPAPDPERITSLFRTLKATAVPLPATLPKHADRLSGERLVPVVSAILRAAQGTPQAPLVGRLLLRSLMQARYVPGPLPLGDSLHFGLASAMYCHFTSPIRRFPDLLIHRALMKALDNNTSQNRTPRSRKDTDHLLRLCEQCNQCERKAQEAEREIRKRLACMVLEKRVGELFEALIVSVNDFGLFVEPLGIPVDGLVRVSTLPDDWYEYDSDLQALLGQAHGLRFQLGQTIKVQLESVSLERLEVNFVLEGTPPSSIRRNDKPRPSGARPTEPRRSGPGRSGPKPGGARPRGSKNGGSNPGDSRAGGSKSGGPGRNAPSRTGRSRGRGRA